MTPDLSFLHLIMNASLVVKCVMLALLVASLVSWTMIFNKRVALNRAKQEADKFEDQFWSSEDLGPLYNRITGKREGATGIDRAEADTGATDACTATYGLDRARSAG